MKSKRIISISMDNALIDKINEKRGRISFSAYLNDILKEIFK